jgi:hypothetical protein
MTGAGAVGGLPAIEENTMNSAVLYATIVGMLTAMIPHASYGNLGRLYTLAWASSPITDRDRH